MGGVTIGDVVFILFIAAVIYGITTLVNRAKGGGSQQTGEKDEDRRDENSPRSS
jgi:hypothetical protein